VRYISLTQPTIAGYPHNPIMLSLVTMIEPKFSYSAKVG